MNVYTVVHIYGDDHDTEEHLTDHCVYNSREKAEAVRDLFEKPYRDSHDRREQERLARLKVRHAEAAVNWLVNVGPDPGEYISPDPTPYKSSPYNYYTVVELEVVE